MTQVEYDKEISNARLLYEQQIRSIKIKYALSNNPYKVGDIITDHIGSGRIRKINVYTFDRFPSCIYECDNLTKRNGINKKEPVRNIYQSNITK